MATTGPSSGGTFADAGGGSAWSFTSGHLTASNSTPQSGGLSGKLKVTNFGFPDLTGSTINTIACSVTMTTDQPGDVNYVLMQLVKGGSATGTDQSGSYAPSGSPDTHNFNPGNTWAGTFAGSDINSTFGVLVQFANNNGFSDSATTVTALTITITYTPAASDPFPLVYTVTRTILLHPNLRT